MYAHFKAIGLTRPHNFNIELNQFFNIQEGWVKDKVPHVIDLLKKIRFLNRFDDEQLKMLLTKVTCRRIKKNSVLFLKG
jgi:hypothetical protein